MTKNFMEWQKFIKCKKFYRMTKFIKCKKKL